MFEFIYLFIFLIESRFRGKRSSAKKSLEISLRKWIQFIIKYTNSATYCKFAENTTNSCRSLTSPFDPGQYDSLSWLHLNYYARQALCTSGMKWKAIYTCRFSYMLLLGFLYRGCFTLIKGRDNSRIQHKHVRHFTESFLYTCSSLKSVFRYVWFTVNFMSVPISRFCNILQQYIVYSIVSLLHII